MLPLLAFITCGIAFSTSLKPVSATPLDAFSLVHTRSKGIDAPTGDGPHLDTFDWASITPSDKLLWHPCYNGTECTRFSVPIDHHDSSNKDQAAIALIRKPSSLGADHPDYRGPIILNPGGPGGSGVQLLATGADLFATILGPQFDIVSFDPRGVGSSVPRASFFKTDFERLAWTAQNPLAIRAENIPRFWANAKVVSAIAQENDDGSLRYLNTDQTARDMLNIVNAYGREKLQYWGISYGSVLGSTFASLFPDKVERLVIDGVPDADDYYSTMWSKSLIDTDKGLDAFASACYQGGNSSCAFFAPSPMQIRHNLAKLFDQVKQYPVSVAKQSVHGVVDIDLLQSTTLYALYGPWESFPTLAQAFAALSRGDGSLILSMNGMGGPLECPADPPFNTVQDSQTAIICNDGPGIPSDLESVQKYVSMMTRLYPAWGPIWVRNRLNCIGWPRFESTNYRGPFNATTSYPLLVVGNTGDPVTPISGASKMASGFPHAVLLTQDSPGHCSLNAPSLCTLTHIRNYFVNGTLPELGTVCTTDNPIFPAQDSSTKTTRTLISSLSAEEQEIRDAANALRKTHLLRPYSTRRAA